MPLTNEWTQDHTGEWVRTTAAAMDHAYNYSVPVSSHAFRCYSCFQYVTFVKGNGARISYFKHSRGEEDKDCEDRSFGTGSYTYGSGLTDVPDPMRIQLEGNRVFLEIGFFPVSVATIEKAIQKHMVIRIRGNSGSPDVYRVDWSRFEPHSTTWFPLPFSWALNYAVEIEPEIDEVRNWGIHRTPLLKHGTVFDAVTGMRIPEKSDIAVGKSYYIVCDRWKSFYSRNGVLIDQKKVINDQWQLYRMSIPAYTDSAADFCFEVFHLRLTVIPSEIQLLWPPAVEGDNLIDTNQSKLYMYVKGESDFETYPAYGIKSRNILEVKKNERIYELNIVSALQMVSLTRYSQRLSFQYVRPWDASPGFTEPILHVLDDQDLEVPDEMEHVPVRGLIRIFSDVDASADLEDEDGFLYRVKIVSGQEKRILDLKRGMKIVIRQGLEILRKITIGIRKKKENVFSEETIPPWRGRMVPFPSRYAWVLTKMNCSPELIQRTTTALKDGMIPLDGLRFLNTLAEDIKHG